MLNNKSDFPQRFSAPPVPVKNAEKQAVKFLALSPACPIHSENRCFVQFNADLNSVCK